MRPQLPVLAILAVLAVPPSAAFADGEPPAGAAQATVEPTPSATTTVAPATPETPAAPVTPATPPASTTTGPAPVPTPTAPGTMATPERSPGAPQLADPDRGSSDRATRAERRARARRAAARREAAREAKDRRRAKDRDTDAGAGPDDERAATDGRTAQDVLDAPATGLSALSVARFRIPPFLLPIYQAAGVQYGIRWEVLAAINEVETDYGRNLNVSSAGARGWMQFMPATWDQYGVDANGDGRADPSNPVDAIFAAARYLKAAGGATDVRRAVFAYNHADWYVDDVLRRARAIAGLPADVVQSLTGLTLAQPPVHVRDAEREARGGGRTGRRHRDGLRLRSTGTHRWGRVAAPAGSDVVAVQDATVVRIGDGPRLGRFIELRDAYGNRYKYANLDELATQHLVARSSTDRDARDEDEHGTGSRPRRVDPTGRGATAADPVPTAPATAGRLRPSRNASARTRARTATADTRNDATASAAGAAASGRTPLVALGPARPRTAADDGGPTTGRGAAGPGDDTGLGGTRVPAFPPSAPAPVAPVPTVPAPVPTVPAPVPTVPAPVPTVPEPAAGAPATPAVPTVPAVPSAVADTADPSAGTAPPTVDATGIPPGTTAPGADAAAGAVPDADPAGTSPTGPGVPGDAAAAAVGPFGTLPGPTVPTVEDTGAVSSTLLVTAGLLGRGLRTPAPPTWLRIARTAPEPTRRSASTRPADRPTAVGARVDDVSRWMVRAGSLRRADVRLRPLRRGSKVLAGSILGTTSRTALRLAIRPAGEDSPRIDPRPIVEGWRLLDDASVFGHDDRSELVAGRGDRPDVGRLLLMSKAQLQARVLADPKLSIYEAGRDDIRTGAIDRRVLATMEYLTANGLHLSISSLKTGHSYLSASGNVSAHSYGSAMDIASVDGTPIMGHQGPGSITASTIRLLLRLQGTVRPNQIISLMTFDGADNTLAMADHDDHIHVGFPRAAGDGGPTLGRQVRTMLQPAQWDRLVGRLAEIDNPTVRRGVSRDATRTTRRTTEAEDR